MRFTVIIIRRITLLVGAKVGTLVKLPQVSQAIDK
jgi:hypothetical protein